MRNPITQSDLTQNIAGDVEYSIQVFDPNNVLIGGAYAYTGLSYGTATSLSLLPNNFEGFQRSANGLGQNLDTEDRQVIQDLEEQRKERQWVQMQMKINFILIVRLTLIKNSVILLLDLQ